jgi:hypothetical protein
MPSVFQLRIGRQRRWRFIAALVLGIASAGYLVFEIGDRRRPDSALLLGVAAALNWFQWSKLPRDPDARIELDDSGIRFFPQEYWQLDWIDWRELTDLKTEANAIWLLFRRDGTEMTRDIPRAHLALEDYTALISEIRRRTTKESSG